MAPRGFSLAIAVFLFISFSASGAVADTLSPGAVIQEAASKIKIVLNNSRLSPAEKRAVIRKTVLPHLDVARMAELVLGTHLKNNRSRMPEFIPLFTGLLERAYLNLALLERVTGIDVIVLSEKIDGDYAEVRTVLTAKNESIDVTYRLQKKGDRWLVYDILVKNLSLIANYRAQFNYVIAISSFDHLLQRMRVKLGEPENEK
ncbi:MAG: ABC transporter substrate-binding protein [Candidatus Sungbacteria bacterium]|nr:ABC transporter substrate-binding protein [Candidatus Sungbacteria bacterium]